MFDRICEKLPRLWLPLLFFLCLAYAWQPLSGGDDVWAHAAIGRWIAQSHDIPRQTLFLWSVPPQPWVYHSWLSQLTFYSLLTPGEALGANFLLLLTALVVVAVFFLLWHAWKTRIHAVSLWMPPVFTMAVFASSLRFRPRPELFSALFLTLLLCLLWREKKTATRRAFLLETAAVFGLFVVWANFHGAVAVGLVLLGAAALCEMTQQRFARPSWKWALWFGTAILAVCVNPYGLEYWQALRPVGGEMFQRIDEWKPFWKTPFLNPEIIVAQFVLVWLAFICWLGNKERNWSQLACLLVMTLLFLSARRHLWLLPIVSLSVIAANARTLNMLALRNNVGLPARNRARALATGILVMSLIFAVSPQALRNGVLLKTTPRAATTYFETQNLASRTPIFNDYENSSFLQWRFGGRPPLFIDLLNAYPDRLLYDYFDIINARPRGRKLLEQKKVQTVILREHKSDSPLAKLAKYLDGDPRWQRVYSGADGAIWLRRNAPF